MTKSTLQFYENKMVGQMDRNDGISKALKVYISKDREKQRLEDEAEAEKTRKKKELDEKKLKEETEFKATKDKLAELIKKNEQLQQEKIKVFEHLKKLLAESNKHRLEVGDLAKLYEIGLAVTHVSNVASHQPVHSTNNVSATVIPRGPSVSVNTQYKTPAAAVIPVQVMPPQKRNRSPSPSTCRSSYGYKQAAGPLPFQKLEDPHRNHEYNRSYLYSKPTNAAPTSSYSAFYPPTQNVAYSHPSQPVHSNTAVYSSYGTHRDNVDVMHKSQSPTGPPPQSTSQHTSLYATHRSAMPTGPTSSLQPTNHVYHAKSNQGYSEEKYYMVRPVHGVIPIQQPPQGSKHGSITSGYPVKSLVPPIGPQAQLHIQPPHGGHHASQSSHHSSQSSHHPSQQPHHSTQQPHHSSQPPHHSSQSSHHSSQMAHHSSLTSHHSSQSHHPSSQASQSLIQQSHQSHYQQSSLHYPPHHLQSHPSSQSSQQSHSQQSPVSVQSHHPSHAGQHHPQHIPQLHVQPHHPPSSHHQLLSHHPSPSIHHSQSQQHMQQAIHHQAMQQSQAHHQSHSQQMHHQQMQQSHIQQHISSHPSQSHQSSQQSQPTSVVTSQTYANQISAIQGGSRVVYSQQNLPH